MLKDDDAVERKPEDVDDLQRRGKHQRAALIAWEGREGTRENGAGTHIVPPLRIEFACCLKMNANEVTKEHVEPLRAQVVRQHIHRIAHNERRVSHITKKQTR